MDRFQEMQVFVAVADEQSFASAARRLNMSAPSVTRAVAALEERIGIKTMMKNHLKLRIFEVVLEPQNLRLHLPLHGGALNKRHTERKSHFV